jgi:hypothetical protein
MTTAVEPCLSPRHPRSPWSADRIRHLRTRWSQGASAARIARELGAGISRSAVLGKLHRLSSAHLSPAARGTRGRGVGTGFYAWGRRSRYPADLVRRLRRIGANGGLIASAPRVPAPVGARP